MDRIQSINPARIAWCCADHGITPEALAAEVGISADRMSAVLHDGEGLTFNQLRSVADFFGRGVLFFLEPEPVEAPQVHTPQFRTLASQKPELSPRLKKLIERVEKQRQIFLSLQDDLDSGAWSPFEAPDLPTGDVAATARRVRQWLGLGDKNNFESYREAIEAKGILVFRTNGYNGKWQIAKESPIAGFALYDEHCPVIVVKKMTSEVAQSFTLMHELAHVLLHKTSWIDEEADLRSQQGREREANQFAGLVLVPDAFLSQIDDMSRPAEAAMLDEWLRPHHLKWGASTEVILRRLMDVGRLPQLVYAAYRELVSGRTYSNEDQTGTRKYRHREPKHMFGDRYVRTVLDSLSAQHITLSKASGYLDGLKIADVHELERHLARA
jgi:Zn-dependent peptidase ImmA (M78 family)/transcriptional regulator with XRE-family HTH domain